MKKYRVTGPPIGLVPKEFRDANFSPCYGMWMLKNGLVETDITLFASRINQAKYKDKIVINGEETREWLSLTFIVDCLVHSFAPGDKPISGGAASAFAYTVEVPQKFYKKDGADAFVERAIGNAMRVRAEPSLQYEAMTGEKVQPLSFCGFVVDGELEPPPVLALSESDKSRIEKAQAKRARKARRPKSGPK